MDSCISVLSPAVANQIAAGEVIQQPSSAVKELMENAIDAGATRIDVNIKDAGATLIQVCDNGKGMTADDAQLCFERHATSKLHEAADLFRLYTMGFRGEALASIASIAQVELLTRTADDELGTRVLISGNQTESVEPAVCDKGTRISVRNLFFNVPARRRFLGSPGKQMQAIKNEFVQLALAHPELELSLSHNGESVWCLKPGTLRQRIGALFGDNINRRLYPVEAETEFVKISGFVGDPEACHKRATEQYFFANHRFIRHPYFRKAVQSVYDPLTAEGMQAVFFLFLEVPAENIDVNVSPTKTEVKFEDEQIIWPILSAAVRESLGKFNAVPSIDFDQEGAPAIDVFSGSRGLTPPKVQYNPSYSPFKPAQRSNDAAGWEKLYENFENGKASAPDGRSAQAPAPYSVPESNGLLGELLPEWDALPAQESQADLFEDTPRWDAAQLGESVRPDRLMQVCGRYVLASMPDSLWMLDQRRAHIRIRFEQYCRQLATRQVRSQTLLFPEELPLSGPALAEFEDNRPSLEALGFGFEKTDEGYLINAVPEHVAGNAAALVRELADAAADGPADMADCLDRRLALRLAQSTAIPYGKFLSADEMCRLCRDLADCSTPNLTPDGQRILVCLDQDRLKKLFP